MVHTPEPLLVCLPGMEDDAWIYDVSVNCKYESGERPETVTRKVLKVWEDDGNREERPEQIAVQLLKDGAIYDTVILNDGNNWRHTWDGLDGSSRWQVTEAETPKGYTVTQDLEGITFVLTNTSQDGQPGKPQEPDTPDGRLPQTGSLWWPVAVLAGCGLILFLAGWRRRHCEGK